MANYSNSSTLAFEPGEYFSTSLTVSGGNPSNTARASFVGPIGHDVPSWVSYSLSRTSSSVTFNISGTTPSDFSGASFYIIGVLYYDSDYVNDDEWRANFTINAKPKTYTVTFDWNGGSAPSGQAGSVRGTSMTPPSGTKPGCRLMGWTTYRTTDGVKNVSATYAVGVNYSISSNFTIYAVWSTPYTIYLSWGAQGSGASSVSGFLGDKVRLPRGTSKDGYRHDGWDPDLHFPIGKENEITRTPTYWANTDITITVDMVDTYPNGLTLYSTWTAPYIITLNANNGVCAVGELTGFTLDKVTLPTCTRDNAIIVGWSTTRIADSAVQNVWQYGVGSEYEVTGDATLYAIWRTPMKVVFDPNHEGMNSEVQYVFVSEICKTPEYNIRDNQAHVGWTYARKTPAKGADIESIAPGDSIQIWQELDNTPNQTDTIILYASWQLPWSVTLNWNNGAPVGGAEYPTTAFDGTLFTLPSSAYREGPYRFLGWKEGSTEYNPGKMVTITKDRTFVANWFKIENYSNRMPSHNPEVLIGTDWVQRDVMVYSNGVWVKRTAYVYNGKWE